MERLYLTKPFTCGRVLVTVIRKATIFKRSSKTISLQPVRSLEWQRLLLFSNIGQIVPEN